MEKTYISAIENRRSIYHLGKNITLSKDAISNLIKSCVKHAPSAFNSQTSRIIVLFEENHDILWEITREALRAKVASEKFGPTDQKITSFKNAYGTILYFEEQDTVKKLQDTYPSYAQNFPVWSEQSTGIIQFAIWCALSEENIGASIQHYNELIETGIREKFSVPASWKITGQMPFGSIESPADKKEFLSVEERVKIF